ncbi:hypothetical protein AB0G95_21870 [Streptomyces virginiae]|uniref:hypothetical protein n=1 Tax=Streptomyces virginiae TaxID=1961 RepID=UPI003441F721
MLRRTLFTATTAAALAAATPAVARPTIGTADVDRLRRHVDRLVAMDDQDGGGPAIERLAVQLTAHALDVQQSSSATQRVRGRLYGLAAEFAAHALWAAVDAGQLDRAQQHLEKAVTLAGLSGDGQVQHQTWRYAAMLADQRGHRTDAIAAAEAAAATAAHRTDPAYASLSAMRLALALTMPGAHDRTRALRAIDRATTAYDRADPHRVRPPSMAFYDRGEVSGLTGIALLRMGQPEQAEFHMHRALSSLRPDQARNRSYYTAQIALAQADQGEADQAVATAHRITPPPGSATTGRVHRLIGQFTDTLTRTAPGARATREWIAHTRTATA